MKKGGNFFYGSQCTARKVRGVDGYPSTQSVRMQHHSHQETTYSYYYIVAQVYEIIKPIFVTEILKNKIFLSLLVKGQEL